jgi:hypothetical protein
VIEAAEAKLERDEERVRAAHNWNSVQLCPLDAVVLGGGAVAGRDDRWQHCAIREFSPDSFLTDDDGGGGGGGGGADDGEGGNTKGAKGADGKRLGAGGLRVLLYALKQANHCDKIRAKLGRQLHVLRTLAAGGMADDDPACIRLRQELRGGLSVPTEEGLLAKIALLVTDSPVVLNRIPITKNVVRSLTHRKNVVE